MRYYYDPLDKACRSLTGAIPCDSEITFRVYEKGGEDDFSADVCMLVLYCDDGHVGTYPMRKGEDGFFLTLAFHEIGLYFYHFEFSNGRYLGAGKLRRGILTERPESWQVTVFDKDYRTPDWFKGKVMYQIFPDRFCKEGEGTPKPYQILRKDWGGQLSYLPNEFGKVLNIDFFGGTLKGIRSKLDYLASLHVGVIYLNPIFDAHSNHRYDTGDYMRIDGLLGTEEDFRDLMQAAEKRGIRVILDGVFNHTGDDSRYFNKYGRYDSLGAYQSLSSPYSEWYRFFSFPDSYDSWWGIEIMPAVNEQCASYRDFICGDGGVLQKWLSLGASGWRLDVADELPDFFLKHIRESVKQKNDEAIVIGEVWEDASNKISYSVRRQYLQGLELDSVMNYPLKDAILGYVLSGNPNQLRETMAELIDNYPKQTLDCLMNLLGTHDTPRALTVFGGKVCTDKTEMANTSLSEEEKVRAKEKLKMAALLQFTLPGVPCIYYGDEIGMEGYADPFCRACFPWDKMDGALGEYYEKLGKIRTVDFPELFKDGDYREIFSENACILFERRKAEKALTVFCNNGPARYTVSVNGECRELLTGDEYRDTFEIRPFSYGILQKK